MKKLFLVVAIATFTASANIYAQEGRQFDPAAMKEMQKKKLKEDLKLTDVQADSVATIQFESMNKLRGLRSLEQGERQAKIKEVNEANKARLKAALGDDSLVEKVLAYQEEQRKQRAERMRNRE
ncbi:MAG: hypothetical protein ACOVO1_09280 [Chitinophagaceae bacterium]